MGDSAAANHGSLFKHLFNQGKRLGSEVNFGSNWRLSGSSLDMPENADKIRLQIALI